MIRPMISLPANKKTLQIIPTRPANTPYADRSFLSFMNIFSNKFVIFMPQPNEINEYYKDHNLGPYEKVVFDPDWQSKINGESEK